MHEWKHKIYAGYIETQFTHASIKTCKFVMQFCHFIALLYTKNK